MNFILFKLASQDIHFKLNIWSNKSSSSFLEFFFLLNGINHFYNTHILKEYAAKRGLIAPKFMVILSGILLLMGG